MKLKELLNNLDLGCRYRLVGAKTGKVLFKSWANKKTDKFNEFEVSGFHAAFHIVSEKFPIQFTIPIIEISLSTL